ncbi:MAG: hypothetical protein WC438_03815 [Candidatus Pacearchaeota archaeon]
MVEYIWVDKLGELPFVRSKADRVGLGIQNLSQDDVLDFGQHKEVVVDASNICFPNQNSFHLHTMRRGLDNSSIELIIRGQVSMNREGPYATIHKNDDVLLRTLNHGRGYDFLNKVLLGAGL